MSRCFPFPPPGYEKKPTTDEPDLLKKEKRKEKKHKKDKKDKEKREKDRSEGKHKEKKEKKDKHRDKKKDKEKGKSSASEEKRDYGQFEGYNGENVEHNNNKKSSVQLQNGEYSVQIHKKEESSREKSSSSDDKKSSIQFRSQNGELVARNRIKAEDSENFKFVQELGRRIRDEEKGTGSHQFVVEGRKNNVNKVETQKTDWRQAIVDGAGFGRNATVENQINGYIPLLLDKKIDPRVEEKHKMQENEGDDKQGGKRKEKEKSKQKKAERDKHKHIKKAETNASLNNMHTRPLENSFQSVGIEGNLKKRKDMETNGVYLEPHLEPSFELFGRSDLNGMSLENEPRPNKMARHMSNISPENGRKLDFVQNPGPSLSDKQAAAQGSSLSSFKVGSKDQRVNGQPVLASSKKPPISAFNHVAAKPIPLKSPPVITNHIAAQAPPIPTTRPPPTQPPSRSSTPPPSSTTAKLPPVVANRVAAPPKKKAAAAAEASTKPPHPDTKHLNQILSIPKLEQWCGVDDQEWLFSSRKTEKTTMEEVQVQVWSEARHIESVDVCALPYVIPY